jgi:hypothetical protein
VKLPLDLLLPLLRILLLVSQIMSRKDWSHTYQISSITTSPFPILWLIIVLLTILAGVFRLLSQLLTLLIGLDFVPLDP